MKTRVGSCCFLFDSESIIEQQNAVNTKRYLLLLTPKYLLSAKTNTPSPAIEILKMNYLPLSIQIVIVQTILFVFRIKRFSSLAYAPAARLCWLSYTWR